MRGLRMQLYVHIFIFLVLRPQLGCECVTPFLFVGVPPVGAEPASTLYCSSIWMMRKVVCVCVLVPFALSSRRGPWQPKDVVDSITQLLFGISKHFGRHVPAIAWVNFQMEGSAPRPSQISRLSAFQIKRFVSY